MKEIISFRNQYGFLSNFFRLPASLAYNGIAYPTVEHAYQAQKTLDDKDRAAIARLSTPGEAKRYGRKLKHLHPNWDSIRLDIMRALVWEKFRDPYLRKLLLDTGDAKLVEENSWGDKFWGICDRTGEGENHLGEILMDVRRRIIRNASV